MNDRAMRPGRATLLAVALTAMAALSTACGTDDAAEAAGADDVVGAETPGPTIADDRFAGRWRVSALHVDDEAIAIESTILIELETEFGEVAVDTACGSDLGAFSLFDDGRGGVSLTGGSERPCDDAARAERDQLLAVLAEVSQWEDDPGLRFTTPTGDRVDLTR